MSLKLTDINNEKYFVFDGAKVQQDKKNVKDNFLGYFCTYAGCTYTVVMIKLSW